MAAGFPDADVDVEGGIDVALQISPTLQFVRDDQTFGFMALLRRGHVYRVETDLSVDASDRVFGGTAIASFFSPADGGPVIPNVFDPQPTSGTPGAENSWLSLLDPLAGNIDAGNDSVTNFLTTDQRGDARLSGAHVDIGAVEAQYAPSNNPPQLVGSTFSTAGRTNTFQFTFTNVPNADFTVLATTNLALPLTNWVEIGSAAQNPPGQYQFTDPGATNYPQRFYQVVSP